MGGKVCVAQSAAGREKCQNLAIKWAVQAWGSRGVGDMAIDWWKGMSGGKVPLRVLTAVGTVAPSPSSSLPCESDTIMMYYKPRW